MHPRTRGTGPFAALFCPQVSHGGIVFTRKRGSRLITLIHRQEAPTFLGIPLALSVNDNLPAEVYELMDLSPQPAGRRSSGLHPHPLPAGDRTEDQVT